MQRTLRGLTTVSVIDTIIVYCFILNTTIFAINNGQSVAVSEDIVALRGNSMDGEKTAPDDDECPVLFSFRLAAGLLVSDPEKQALLESESVEDRLRLLSTIDVPRSNMACFRLIVNHLRKKVAAMCESPPIEATTHNHIDYSSPASRSDEQRAVVLVLACQECKGALALEREVFRVPGASGTIGAYVNPHG